MVSGITIQNYFHFINVSTKADKKKPICYILPIDNVTSGHSASCYNNSVNIAKG